MNIQTTNYVADFKNKYNEFLPKPSSEFDDFIKILDSENTYPTVNSLKETYKEDLLTNVNNKVSEILPNMNIDRLAIGQPRALSHMSKSNPDPDWSIKVISDERGMKRTFEQTSDVTFKRKKTYKTKDNEYDMNLICSVHDQFDFSWDKVNWQSLRDLYKPNIQHMVIRNNYTKFRNDIMDSINSSELKDTPWTEDEIKKIEKLITKKNNNKIQWQWKNVIKKFPNHHFCFIRKMFFQKQGIIVNLLEDDFKKISPILTKHILTKVQSIQSPHKSKKKYSFQKQLS